MDDRAPLDSDQENIEKAFCLIKDIMIQNPQIEATLWAASFWSILAQGYRNNGASYEQFKNESYAAVKHYKQWWNNE